MRIENQLAISWLTDYFSGCMNTEFIDGYDMPSLVVFDTECIEILSEEKRRIFESEREKKKGEHSAKEISEDLSEIGKLSNQQDALEKIVLAPKNNELENEVLKGEID